MTGPKALLSLFKTMTIYEGPEGAVVTLSEPPISEQNLYAADLFSNGMPIYPSTWSDTGNMFYYIFCTYLISMNNYCYHDCLCNIYYHYFNLYSFSNL